LLRQGLLKVFMAREGGEERQVEKKKDRIRKEELRREVGGR